MRPAAAIGVTVAALALALGAWYLLKPADPGALVRSRLQAFSEEVNKSTIDGKSPEVHAAQLAGFFTEDVAVDFGQGTAPIQGRETVIGMAGRLQPRTAAFRLKFEDVSVVMGPDGETADVRLTAEFIRRSITTGEESLDAREFSLGMRRVSGEWRIARVTAVETLK